MQISYIGEKWWNVLETFKIYDELRIGHDPYKRRILVLHDGDVYLLQQSFNEYHLIDIHNYKKEIEAVKLTKWRSEKLKNKRLEYMDHVLGPWIAHRRKSIIDAIQNSSTQSTELD